MRVINSSKIGEIAQEDVNYLYETLNPGEHQIWVANEGRQLEETEKYLNSYWVLSTENTNVEKILIIFFGSNIDK